MNLEYLTIEQASAISGFTVNQLYKLDLDGVVKVKRGTRIMFNQAELRKRVQFLNDQQAHEHRLEQMRLRRVS